LVQDGIPLLPAGDVLRIYRADLFFHARSLFSLAGLIDVNDLTLGRRHNRPRLELCTRRDFGSLGGRPVKLALGLAVAAADQ